MPIPSPRAKANSNTVSVVRFPLVLLVLTSESTSGSGLGTTSRLSLGSTSYDIGSSRLDTSSSRYSPRLESSRLETSPSRWDKELETGSSFRASRYDTSGSSLLERTSKYASLEDSGTSSRVDRASRYSIAEDAGTSRYDRASRYSVTADSGGSRLESITSRYSTTEAGDTERSPSRWDRTSRYATESSDADLSPYTRRESRTSRFLTDASELDVGSSRYERSSRLTRGTSELSDTGSAKWDRTASRSYAIETLDTETPSSERYEQRLLAELELDTKPSSRWDRTSPRYAIEWSDHDTDYSRLDRKTSRLSSVTSDSDQLSKYERTSRYVSDLDSSASKWESEYASQYNRSSRLDRQSSKLSTDSTELETGLSRYGTSRLDRQGSRSSTDIDIDSSFRKSSKLETIQSYGLITEPVEDQSDSGLVRTSSGIIRATVRRESEPETEPSKPRVNKTIKSITQTGLKYIICN